MKILRFTEDLSLEERFELGRLHQAAADGDIGEIRRLLQTEHKKLLNVFDELSLTPLMRAAMNDHIAAVKLLVAAGSDVNAHDDRRIGNTAINEVAGDGSFEMVEALLEAGADPTIRGWMNLNALDRARHRTSRPAIYALLAASAEKFKKKKR
ncbi:MAG TPA: ankyrin repeat domain-containing protein [Candidatus Sulfotelmatobacter sp.]|jgi:ankyrin repeat protein|nr:ankyrin repeat domain-containing protein [Candidatus Sulfotelmatobacter sp.]